MAALVRHQVRYLRSNLALTVAYVVVPFALIAYSIDAFRIYLQGEGFPSATGAELIVPGVSVLYMFLVLTHVLSFTYDEHRWSTWDRLRAGPASLGAVVAAKLLTLFGHLVLQTFLIFLGGALLFSFALEPRTLLLAPIVVLAAVVAVGWAALGYTLAPTNAVFDAWAYAGGVVFAAVGGALSPLGLLPSAVRDISPVSPAYWVLRAAQDVILEGKGGGAILRPSLALASYGIALLAGAALLHRPDVRRRGRLS